LLVSFHELQPQQAAAEIERLIDSYPSQRGSALRTRVRIVARQSAKITELSQLAGIVSQLPRGDQRFLTRVPEVVGQVLAIAATHEVFRNLPGNMPAFRLRQAEQVCVVITRFRDQISGFPEPVASEFRTAALHWLSLADAQRDESRSACQREPYPQVFRAGDPVQGQKSEAFIPRQQTIQEMAGMILASQGCPGILLYARRRMGKSTCLQNLTGFIPQNVDVAFFNLQDPVFGSLSLLIKEFRHSITECLSAEHAGNSPQNARKSRPPHSSTDKPSNARELLAGFSQFLWTDRPTAQPAQPQAADRTGRV
jgi:hypothetical protein